MLRKRCHRCQHGSISKHDDLSTFARLVSGQSLRRQLCTMPIEWGGGGGIALSWRQLSDNDLQCLR